MRSFASIPQRGQENGLPEGAANSEASIGTAREARTTMLYVNVDYFPIGNALVMLCTLFVCIAPGILAGWIVWKSRR